MSDFKATGGAHYNLPTGNTNNWLYSFKLKTNKRKQVKKAERGTEIDRQVKKAERGTEIDRQVKKAERGTEIDRQIVRDKDRN